MIRRAGLARVSGSPVSSVTEISAALSVASEAMSKTKTARRMKRVTIHLNPVGGDSTIRPSAPYQS